MADHPGANHPRHQDSPVPGGRVAPETGAGGTATRDLLTPEEQRELAGRLARPDGPRDDAGRAPDPGDLPGEADDVRAAFGTAGDDAGRGGPQGHGGMGNGGMGYGGMGGDGTTQSGILSGPGGSEADPTRIDDVPASERGNPDELAGRDDTRRNPPRREDAGPGGRTVFSNAARAGAKEG